jgi:hypothetical protein
LIDSEWNRLLRRLWQSPRGHGGLWQSRDATASDTNRTPIGIESRKFRMSQNATLAHRALSPRPVRGERVAEGRVRGAWESKKTLRIEL